MGSSRGGISSKIHCVANENDLPIDFMISGGEVHDSKEAKGLIENKRALYVLADKGYDSQSIVEEIKKIGAIPVIPSRVCCNIQREYDRGIYKKEI